MPLTVRIAGAEDTNATDDLCKQVFNAEANTAFFLETALLSVVAHDTDSDALVGYLCLDDMPCVRMGQNGTPDAEGWLHLNYRANASSSAFVRTLATLPEYEIEAVPALLRAAFLTIHSMGSVLLAGMADIPITEPGLSSHFTKSTSEPSLGVCVYRCTKTSVLTPLSVRSAVVEDHDDMEPLLHRAAQRLPALAQLPASSRPEEPFALTRVVSGQDADNVVLVAHAESKLVGFMVLSTPVDTSVLSEAFDLHPFDNFLVSEEYEQQRAAAADAARAHKLVRIRAQKARTAADDEAKAARNAAVEAALAEGRRSKGNTGNGGHEEPSQGSGLGAQASSASMGTQASQPKTEGGEAGEGGGEAGDEEAKEAARAAQEAAEAAREEAEAEPTEEEIRAVMIELYGQQVPQRGTTMFVVSMLCMDEGYEGQAAELLEHAFEALPGKEYCAVLLPHSSAEPQLLRVFARVPQQAAAGAAYPEVLYVNHRSSLLPGFSVRLGSRDDRAGVQALVEGMPNAQDITTAYSDALTSGSAAVAVCDGEVVGVCTVNGSVDLALLKANFALNAHMDFALHDDSAHGEIDMYCINPIFAHQHRIFLSAVQRLMNKSILYYALPPDQAPPDMAEVLSQAGPRFRLNEKLQAEFALYLFTRRDAFRLHTPVNARVVVVGASECGLAVLERLLLDTALRFNSITLLAPGGIRVGGPACTYTAAVVAKLGLEARATLLDAELVALDRAACTAELSDGSMLRYDVLVLATGLQDQSRYRFAESEPGVAGLLVTDTDLAADFTMADAASMDTILVYGESLAAYSALAVLESKGAAEKVLFVSPPVKGDPAAPGHPLAGLLREAADAAQVPLPEPLPAEVAQLMPASNAGADDIVSSIQSLQAQAAFEYSDAAGAAGLLPPEDERPQGVTADLVVGCAPPAVNHNLFMCLNDAGLVFDGRLVVDARFATNDALIMAGGSATKLSRRYGGGGLLMEHFESREQGHALASVLSQRFGNEHVQLQHAVASVHSVSALPALRKAKVVGCSVPGGLTLLYAACPAAMRAPSLSPPKGGRKLQTLSALGLAAVILNEHSVVHAVVYLGRLAPPAQRLSALVGLHSNYLGDVVQRYDAGQAEDLVSVLGEPWAELLLHDDFAALRMQLLAESQAAAERAAGAEGPMGHEEEMKGLVTSIQDAVLEFVRARNNELPLLHVPGVSVK